MISVQVYQEVLQYSQTTLISELRDLYISMVYGTSYVNTWIMEEAPASQDEESTVRLPEKRFN